MMCFYHDYDWYSSICNTATAPATKPLVCDECHRPITIGQPVHHIYMQEAEECRVCEHGECECKGECCACEMPDPGETFNYDRCDECDKFLQAVEEAESEAGCSVSEARPSLGGMTEEINNSGADEAKRYFQMALRLFPELKASGYLGWLWKKMF